MRSERIAPVYDATGPFATVFVDVSRGTETGAHEVEVRVRNAADRLRGLGAPDPVVESIRERLLDAEPVPSPASEIVVANEQGVLFDDVVRTRTPHPVATWHGLPDLCGWIAEADRSLEFLLVLVDHEGGTVSHHGGSSGGAADHQTAGEADPHEQKVRGGGLAHRRMQRTAENVWAANAKAVAELVAEQLTSGPELLLLAGDPSSRAEVRDALGEPAGVEIVELDHGGRARDGGDDALSAAVEEVVSLHLSAQRVGLVHELQERLGRDDAAVSGVRGIVEALVRGQVGRLLIDSGEATKQLLTQREYPGLELAGVPTDESVRADLALVAAAAATSADITVLPSRALRGATAAALLRWSA